MKRHRHVVIIGPAAKIETGQSYVTSVVKASINNSVFLSYSPGRFVNFFKLINALSFAKIVYFTCSRSNLGFLRDCMIILLAKFFGCKLINHLHGSDFDDFYQKSYFKFLIDYCYNKIDHHILLYQGQSIRIPSYPGGVSVIENCIHTKERDLLIEGSNKPKSVDIIYFSNLLYSKGIIKFLIAIDKIKIPLRIVVAGEFMSDDFMAASELSAVFFKKINSSHHKVSYNGAISGSEKVKVLTRSKLMVLPTFYKMEAQPVAIIEALLAGCRIVTTSAGGIPRLLENSEHVILNVDCAIEELADAIFKEYKKAGTPINVMHLDSNRFSQEQFKDSILKVIKCLEN